MFDRLGVLIINEDPEERARIIQQLDDLGGMRVKKIAGAKSFARALNKGQFNLVITDYKTGWTSGLEVLKAVKSSKPDCPVVMLIDTDREDILNEAIGGGVDAFLPKRNGDILGLSGIVKLAFEQSRQNQALVEAQNQYQGLCDSIPMGLYQITPDGYFMSVNLAMVGILGYQDRESILEINITDIYHNPETRQEWETLVVREVEVHGNQVRLLRHDGEAVWVRQSERAVMDDTGQVIRFEGKVQDISENVNAQQEKDQLFRWFESLREGAHSADADDKRLYEQALIEILNMTQSQYAYYGFLDGDGGDMTIYSCSNASLDTCQILEIHKQWPAKELGIWAEVLRQRKAIIIDEYQRDPLDGVGPLPGKILHDRVLAIPIFSHDRMVGLVVVADKLSQYEEEDVKQIEAFATNIQVILDRRQVEEVVLKSREFLDRIINGIFERLMVIGLDYRMVDVNQRFLQQYNRNRDEIVGRFCYEVTHHNNQPCHELGDSCPFQTVLKTRSSVRLEHAHKTEASEDIFVEILALPLLGPDREIEAIVEVMHDVTEHRRDEEKIRIEARRAEALVRTAGRLNAKLDIQSVLSAVCEETAHALEVPIVIVSLFDEESEAFIASGQHGMSGEQFESIQPVRLEECRAAVEKEAPQFIRDIRPLSATSIVTPPASTNARSMASVVIRRKKHIIGCLHVVTVNEERLFTKDELTLLQGLANQAAVALENARLYQAEQARYHEAEALRRAALVLTSTIDMREVLNRILAELENVVPYDNASIQLLKGESLEFISGRGFKNLSKLVGTTFPVWVKSRYVKVFESRKPFFDHYVGTDPLMSISDSHAEPQHHSWLGVPLLFGVRLIGIMTLNKSHFGYYNEDHARIALTYSAHAATAIENARLYEDLQNQIKALDTTQSQLVQSEKLAAIGKLVAGVAHELNNPLATILLRAQLAQAKTNNMDTTHDMGVIVSESQRAAGIVRNLLDFSRQRSPERKPVGINDVLNSAITLMNYEFRTHNIKYSFHLESDLPPTMADPDQLQQVFINVLKNAHQAMVDSNGSGNLSIKSEVGLSKSKNRIREESSVIRISFRDDGPGIDPGELPHIFDPFFTTKDEGQGTGLGLSVCHGIITAHGGHIWAESEFGEGATFYIELPIIVPQEHEHPPRTVQLQKPESDRTKHILILDDEVSVLETLKRALEHRGYRVDAVGDGETGLTYISKTDYDLILCDIRMPGLSGPEFFQELQVLYPEMVSRIIFTTGDVVSPSTRRFLEESSLPCLHKPFELRKLYENVEVVVAKGDS